METRKTSDHSSYPLLKAALEELTGLSWEKRPKTKDLLATTRTFECIEEAQQFAEELNTTYPMGNIFVTSKGKAIRIVVFNAAQLNQQTQFLLENDRKLVLETCQPVENRWYEITGIAPYSIGGYVAIYQNSRLVDLRDGKMTNAVSPVNMITYKEFSDRLRGKKRTIREDHSTVTKIHHALKESYCSHQLEKAACKTELMEVKLDFIEGYLSCMYNARNIPIISADSEKIIEFRKQLESCQSSKKKTNAVQRKLNAFIENEMQTARSILPMLQGVNSTTFFQLQEEIKEIKKMQPHQKGEMQDKISDLRKEIHTDWPMSKCRK